MALLMLAATASPAWESPAWAELLARHVKAGRIDQTRLTMVEYAALGADPAYLKALADFEAADPDAMAGEDERFAFWINAYNLMAIRTVVDHYPLASIRDAGGIFRPVWKRVAGKAGGREVTLDQIEHEILRPRFRDPRVHFAIVCASVSCPDLRPEPYRAATLSAQLDDAALSFLANPAKGLRIDEEKKSLQVSSIFKWFAEDFAATGGVVAFVKAKADGDIAARVAAFGDNDLTYLDYDWSLNDRARRVR